MIDKYTKIILTTIALLLGVLVTQNSISPANALSGACTLFNPCYVNINSIPSVYVEGGRITTKTY